MIQQDSTSASASSSPEDVVRRYRPVQDILPPSWSEAIMSVNGIEQHYYRTGGNKPPLILLHGLMESALAWLRVAHELEGDYDLILLDARGHGLSERVGPTGDYTQDALTDDVSEAMRALGLGQVRVLGFSQGGATGIHLAADHAEQVHSLIVAGWGEQPAGRNAAEMAQSPGYLKWFDGYLAYLGKLKILEHPERMALALQQRAPGAGLPSEEEYVADVETGARLDLDLVRRSVAMWEDVDENTSRTRLALQRVSCPTLLMKSEFFPQPGAPKSVVEELHDRPNVRVVRFVNTGHMIHREQFEPFVTLVKQFLQP
jgi:pimeloyl-ACP methyl ester carboxylesterase